jgi:uncharacterized protein with FMN-binding domain
VNLLRNLTKSIFGVVSLGVLASSYSIGLATQEPTSLTPGPVVSPTTTDPLPSFTSPENEDEYENEEYENEENEAEDGGDDVAAPAPSASKAPTNTAKPTATAAPTTTAAPTNTKEPTKKPAAAPTPTSTKATPPPAPTGAKGNGPGVGDELYYKYGSIQLAVVKSGNVLTEVKILKATTYGNEFANVPGDLAKAAVAVNGTNFANVSGATYTSNAFRKSLESALAKL